MKVIIEQLDVQRKGGACGKYPVACVVRDLLSEASVLRPFKKLRVLDLTYGQGIFWLAVPQAMIVGFDPNPNIKHVRRPWMFIPRHCQEWREHVPRSFYPDVIAVDPPWAKWELRTRKHFTSNGSEKEILDTAIEAAKYYSVPILVHYKDRWVPEAFTVIAELWFQGRHRYSRQPKPSWFGILKPEVRHGG